MINRGRLTYKRIDGRTFTLRKGGYYATCLRPSVTFSEDNWEALKRVAANEDCRPEEYVQNYLDNITMQVGDAEAQIAREGRDEWPQE